MHFGFVTSAGINKLFSSQLCSTGMGKNSNWDENVDKTFIGRIFRECPVAAANLCFHFEAGELSG